MSESRRDKTISKFNTIHVYDPNDVDVDIVVYRLSRRCQSLCNHKWLPVSWLFQGNGGWKVGCSHCGALARK